jgi:hypothetical protein
MARRTFTSQLYRLARASATGRSIRTGHVGRRAKNIAVGACARPRRRVEAPAEMSDEDRIDRLEAELEDLPPEEREAGIASLSDEDRAAVRDADLEATEAAEDDDELGGGD